MISRGECFRFQMNKKDNQNEARFERETDSLIYNFLREQHRKAGLNSGKAKENYYSSIFDFILQEGHFYKPKKLSSAETVIVKEAISGIKFKPEQKDCFYNAQLLVLRDRYHMLKYVEGFATNDVMPVLHAWCEIQGNAVDITWKDDNQFRLGMFSEKNSYYGVVLPTDKIRERVSEKETTDSLIDDRKNGFPLLKDRFIKRYTAC